MNIHQNICYFHFTFSNGHDDMIRIQKFKFTDCNRRDTKRRFGTKIRTQIAENIIRTTS